MAKVTLKKTTVFRA